MIRLVKTKPTGKWLGVELEEAGVYKTVSLYDDCYEFLQQEGGCPVLLVAKREDIPPEIEYEMILNRF